MNWVGIDIGGANIKLAAAGRPAVTSPFPMWSHYESLPQKLRELLAEHDDDSAGLAVTMTGELADGFQSKVHGVRWIAESVAKSAGNRDIRFYCIDGRWCDAATACAQPLAVAASNWHALACFAAGFLEKRCGFLIDIGSTTTDVIPIAESNPTSTGCQPLTDLKRLAESQLLYTGAWRSPLNALLNTVVINDQSVSIANEMFATIADAYIWRGHVPEDPNNLNTANAGPATRQAASQRLSRMLCSDVDEIGQSGVDAIADAAIESNFARIATAIQRVVSDHPTLPLEFVISGSGSWVAKRILSSSFHPTEITVVQLGQQLGTSASTCAAAYAVMTLAGRDHGGSAPAAAESTGKHYPK